MKKIYLLIAIFCCFNNLLSAQEFRKIRAIRTPNPKRRVLTDLDGNKVKPVQGVKNLSPQLVEKVMRKFIASWNTSDMQKYLSNSFYQKDRLVDSMNSKLPADAALRLLSVGSHRVIDQGYIDSPNGKVMVSRVAVLARTQVEYHDKNGKLQRREGEQEYTIKIKQRVAK